MNSHRLLWWPMAGAAGLLGLTRALTALTVGSVVTVCVVLALSGCLGAVLMAAHRGRRRASLRSCAIWASAAAGATFAIAGLVAVLGAGLGAVGAILVVARSPWAARLLSVTHDTSLSPATTHASSARSTNDELCLAWRTSFAALQRTANPALQSELVEIRGRILDELELRDPVGFARWVNAGASSARTPPPHLSH